jgi:hypothetical protein
MDAYDKGQNRVNEGILRGAKSLLAGAEAEAAMHAGLGRALRRIQNAEKHPGVFVSVDHPFASLLQSHIAEQAMAKGRVQPAPGTKGEEFLETKFDDHDLAGWIGSFFGWVRGIEKHDFVDPPEAPEPFDNTSKVALLGDWGTGLYGAPACSKTIEAEGDKYQLLIHLGDVYYAGQPSEVHDRFLDLWPKNPNAKSRALNSNHEMYSGGDGYFDETLVTFGQASSCFALQNDSWLIVALDTGYRESVFNLWNGGVDSNQVEWLNKMIDQAGNRKAVLLSHHQPFTLLDPRLYNNMPEKLGSILTGRKIFAWYWGHEHRCVMYDQHPLHGYYGRCCGHSGYPYYRSDLGNAPKDPDFGDFRRIPGRPGVPGGLVLDGPNPYVEGHENEYGTQGYVNLMFNGASLQEQVLRPDGSVIWEKKLA